MLPIQHLFDRRLPAIDQPLDNQFLGGSTGLPSTGFGTSPITVFSGQTENAGHFFASDGQRDGAKRHDGSFGSEEASSLR